MDRNQTIDVLNGLIETDRDGQEGFQEAADNVQNADLKTFFADASLERARFVGELQQEVRALGGDPADTCSTAGALHRVWIDIKGTLTGRDDGSIPLRDIVRRLAVPRTFVQAQVGVLVGGVEQARRRRLRYALPHKPRLPVQHGLRPAQQQIVRRQRQPRIARCGIGGGKDGFGGRKSFVNEAQFPPPRPRHAPNLLFVPIDQEFIPSPSHSRQFAAVISALTSARLE